MSDTVIAQDILASYRRAIDGRFPAYFTAERKRLDAQLSRHGLQALDCLEDFSCRPGKRFRGSLCAYMYDNLTGQKFSDVGLNAAIAIELIQNYLLIVDDVMDQSVVRRSKPTVHKLFEAQLTRNDKTKHISEMLAINVGLLAQHMASACIAQSTPAGGNVAKALEMFQQNILLTCFGQIDDLYADMATDGLTEVDIIRTYTLKSSTYTFNNPLHVAFALAGTLSDKSVRQVESYGIPAGIAFQLRDDMLGMFGDTKTTGKSNNDDLREGKYTVLIDAAMRIMDATDKKQLQATLGNLTATDAQFAQVKSALEACGAQHYVENMITTQATQAKAALQHDVWTDEQRQFLAGIVDIAIERKA